MERTEVGKRIRKIRKELGLSMSEFGEKIGNVKSGVVSNWENGKQLPNNERIKKIAELGNIDVYELLYGMCATEQKIIDQFTHEKSNLKANINTKLLRFIENIEFNHSLPFVNKKDRYYFLSLLDKLTTSIKEVSQDKKTAENKVIDVLSTYLFNELSIGIEMKKHLIVSTVEIIRIVVLLFDDEEMFYNSLINHLTEMLETIGKEDKTVTHFIISQKINNLSENINDFVAIEKIEGYKPKNMLFKDNVINTLDYDTYKKLIATFNKLEDDLNNDDHHADK